MSKWEGAFAHLRRRSADAVRSSVGVTTPFQFDASVQTSDLPAFLDSQWELIGETETSLIELPGRDLNLVNDMLTAAAKFYHVVDCARSQVARGAMTWGMIDAYHACLVGAKAMFALYGVFAYGVRGRTVLIDFRPEFGSVDDAKKFRKVHGSMLEPIRVLTPKVKLLQQQDAWDLAIRLCNITPNESAEDSELLGRVKGAASSPIASFRNAMLYDSVAWEWLEDLAPVPMPEDARLARLSAEDEAQSPSLQALSVIFQFVTKHIANLGEIIGFDPATLSPTFTKKASADSLLT